MTGGPLDLEAEYNNRLRVPEHPAIIAGWARDAAAYREGARAELDLAYGGGAREKLDLFLPMADVRGAALFIHGGYWQGLDRSFFSHLARGLTAHGVAVAVPSYDLCPAVRVGDIVAEMRVATACVAARFGGRLLLTGHSAGGHLAALMLREESVAAALPISGLFELAPLIETSVNGALRMDRAEADALSPALMPAPAGKRITAAVGGAESGEYHRQSRLIADRWGGRPLSLPRENHFTVVASLAEPDGVLTREALDLMGLD